MEVHNMTSETVVPPPATPCASFDNIPAVLDSARVAELLGCTKATIEDLLPRGHLPGVKLGRGWCIPGAALIQRLNDMATEQAEERRQAPTQQMVIASGNDSQRAARAVEPAAGAPPIVAPPSASIARGRIEWTLMSKHHSPIP
jgi:excisionase family DNA binding protein